jgi:predicted GNAT superfamily acetyltransferase
VSIVSGVSGDAGVSGEAAVAAGAWRDARAAAARAGVEIAALDGRDVALAQGLIGGQWGSQQIPQSNLLLAVAHAGNTLLGATRNGEAVGVVLGFLGWEGGLHLHSHMTAVVTGEQSRGVGYALKLWQRATCLDHGVDEIRWTYDPLIARNAHFNLRKLGADVVAFHPDFYGAMDDAVNAGDASDRFEVAWRLRSSRVLAAVAGHRVPVTGTVGTLDIPADYDRLRHTDPAGAREVRQTSREAFQRLGPAGLGVEWERGRYVFVRPRVGGAHG